MPEPTIEQFQGCLVGCAVGDAVGAPVEAHGPETIEPYIENMVRPREFNGVQIRSKYDFGQYTDDTQLTRELAISLIEKGSLDPEAWGERIADMFKNKHMVGYGNATKNAAFRLAAKCPWQHAGEPHPSAGNGSAMRAGPIGLAFYDATLSSLATAAKLQGYVTHQSDQASAGAAAIASAVALAMQVEEVEPLRFLKTVSSVVKKIDQRFGDYVLLIPTIMVDGDDAVVEWCRTFQEGDKWPGISPYVVSSVLWALYSFVKTPDDFWETIITSIMPGGDVDTTGAMAGAISGARVGLDGIPEDIAKLVNDKGEHGYDFLCGLGRKLYEQFYE